MSGLQWRRFVFFDREVVKDPQTHEARKVLEVFEIFVCSACLPCPEIALTVVVDTQHFFLVQGIEIVSATSGRGYVVVGGMCN